VIKIECGYCPNQRDRHYAACTIQRIGRIWLARKKVQRIMKNKARC
jgi:hypothetical protein